MVATFGRPGRIRRLVDALLGTDQGVDLEVVVVDDGSPHPATEVLRPALDKAVPGTLRIERLHTNRGPATARNVGWRAARGRVVAFTDDDCVPRPGWLAALVAGVDAGADIVQGRTVPDPDVWGSHGAFFHTVDINAPTVQLETCNIAYRRELLVALGGFDEQFGPGSGGPSFGEDTDLAWRAIESGARVDFVHDAVVVHEVVANDYIAWLKARHRRAGMAYLLAKHPQLRDRLVDGGIFLSRKHPRAVVGLLGALLTAAPGAGPTTRLVGAVLGMQYLHFRVNDWRIHGKRRWWPLTIPAMMLGDCYEAAVVTHAAWRERILLL